MIPPKVIYLRRMADRCRLLLSITIKPRAREQLWLWARELDMTVSRLEARRKPGSWQRGVGLEMDALREIVSREKK